MNQRQVQLTFRQLLVLIIIVIASSFLLLVGIVSLLHLVQSGKDWVSALIGALGSILGAVIGGVVTYLVATLQIQRSQALSKTERIGQTYNALRLIKAELLDNQPILETLKQRLPDDSPSRKLLADEYWKTATLNIPTALPDRLLIKLNVLYKRISYIRNAPNTSHYNSELLSAIISDLTSAITELHTYLTTIKTGNED